MLLYGILLYKHVFDYLYLCTYVCLMLISCSPPFKFPFFLFLLVFRWYELNSFCLYCIVLFTLVPIFSSSCPQQYHPTHGTMMHRQSENGIEHILWQHFPVAGAYKGRYWSVLPPRSSKKAEQLYVCLLTTPGQFVFVCYTSCTAGLLVNRQRDESLVNPVRSWQDCYLLLAINV